MLKRDVIKQENIMVLNTKISKGIEYLYFQAGKDTLYIGPKGQPSKAKEENVVRALDHVKERMDHYAESYDELLPLLTAEARERRLSTEISGLNDRVARYTKQLPTKPKQ